MADDIEKSMEELAQNTEKTGAAAKDAGLKIEGFSKSLEKINAVMDAVNKSTKILVEDLSGFQTTIQNQVIKSFGELVEHTEAWKEMLDGFVRTGAGYWNNIKTTFQEKYDTVTEMAKSDFDAVSDAWGSIKSVFKPGEEGFWKKGKAAVASVQDIISRVKKWSEVWKEITEFGETTWDAVKKDALEAWEKMSEAFDQDTGWLKETYGKLAGAFKWEGEDKPGWKGELDKITQIGQNVWGVIKETGSQIGEEGVNIIGEDLKSVGTAWEKIKEVFKPGGNIIKEGKSAVSAVKDLVGRGKSWEKRVDGFESAGSGAWEMIKGMGEGAWTGISGMPEKAGTAWEGIKESWSNFKNIFSPEKKTDEVVNKVISKDVSAAAGKVDALVPASNSKSSSLVDKNKEAAVSSGKNSGITINLQKLVENIHISGSNLRESASQIQDEVTDALINALKMAQIQMQ
ncbi:MAG: hypothetical protein FWF54_04560 [Candidatus Azobacteroides sp.]|nr:hypothetical protein [Candidatus Azobacteroides sp.]